MEQTGKTGNIYPNLFSGFLHNPQSTLLPEHASANTANWWSTTLNRNENTCVRTCARKRSARSCQHRHIKYDCKSQHSRWAVGDTELQCKYVRRRSAEAANTSKLPWTQRCQHCQRAVDISIGMNAHMFSYGHLEDVLLCAGTDVMQAKI